MCLERCQHTPTMILKELSVRYKGSGAEGRIDDIKFPLF